MRLNDQFRQRALDLFLGSLGLGVVAVLVGVIGRLLDGGGAPGAVRWIGLILGGIAWLVLLVSCLMGFINWRQSRQLPFWVILAFLLLVAGGLLEWWGFAG